MWAGREESKNGPGTRWGDTHTHTHIVNSWLPIFCYKIGFVWENVTLEVHPSCETPTRERLQARSRDSEEETTMTEKEDIGIAN